MKHPVEESDAERKIISMHSKGHRGHIYLWTLFNCDIYALGSFSICHDVVMKCQVCAQNKPRRKLRYDRLNLAAGQILSYAIDFKGPIACNGKKKYVLCCVELNYRLVSFSLANSLEAKEVAQLLFDSIIKHYGSEVEIHSDKEFFGRYQQRALSTRKYSSRAL